MRVFLCLFLFLLVFHAFPFALVIHKKPIIFNQSRIALTQEYQCSHYGICTDSIAIDPKIIVLHWTATVTLQGAFDEFNRVEAVDRGELNGGLNVSAHFLVDRNGTIFQLMPDNWMARHVIGLNHFAIGIENVGGVGKKSYLTEAQAQADAYLIEYLKMKYPSIRYVIGHHDYLFFKLTPFWLEKNIEYQTTKVDPGNEFMLRVHALIKHLKLPNYIRDETTSLKNQ